MSYSAGYAVQNEAQTVPAAPPLQLNAFSPYGPWGSDLGVIAASVSADADSVVASVASEGDVKYAAIQEYGGKTSAHEILPVKAQALAFVVGGAQLFARRVEHPGSLIPERSYLRSSLDDMRDEILAALADAATETWERA